MTVFAHPEPMPVPMPDAMNDGLGGAWLGTTYGLELVMPLKVVSRMGGWRVTKSVAGVTTETFVAALADELSRHVGGLAYLSGGNPRASAGDARCRGGRLASKWRRT